MKNAILALGIMLSGLSFTEAQNIPVSQRQIDRVEVTSARLRLLQRTADSNEYAIRVTAQYPNSCFAPNANRVQNRIVFNVDSPENRNRIDVQVFELPDNRRCTEIYDPVEVTFELRSLMTAPRSAARIFVNGVRAR